MLKQIKVDVYRVPSAPKCLILTHAAAADSASLQISFKTDYFSLKKYKITALDKQGQLDFSKCCLKNSFSLSGKFYYHYLSSCTVLAHLAKSVVYWRVAERWRNTTLNVVHSSRAVGRRKYCFTYSFREKGHYIFFYNCDIDCKKLFIANLFILNRKYVIHKGNGLKRNHTFNGIQLKSDIILIHYME